MRERILIFKTLQTIGVGEVLKKRRREKLKYNLIILTPKPLTNSKFDKTGFCQFK